MRVLLLVTLVFLAGCAATPPSGDVSPEARSPEVAAVEATIQTLFDGMRAGDSTMVRSTFHTEMSLHTVVPNGDGFRMMTGDPEAFVQAVGSPREDVWDERVGDIAIRVDQGLAQAWVPYSFYVGDTFSHCGVNVIHFAHLDDRWQIVNLVDTRRQVCD